MCAASPGRQARQDEAQEALCHPVKHDATRDVVSKLGGCCLFSAGATNRVIESGRVLRFCELHRGSCRSRKLVARASRSMYVARGATRLGGLFSFHLLPTSRSRVRWKRPHAWSLVAWGRGRGIEGAAKAASFFSPRFLTVAVLLQKVIVVGAAGAGKSALTQMFM
jgi:hypothetical protein